MELERIVRTETDVESILEEIRKRIPFVGEEKGVVRQR